MGRPATIINSKIFGSDELKAIQDHMRWNEREALGCLALLWQGSQNRKIAFATSRQIGQWARTDSAETTKLIAILADELVGLIKKIDDDHYEIIGNTKQIAKITALKTSGKKGGKKTREKWRNGKPSNNQTQDAEPNARAIATAEATAKPRPYSSLLSTILNSPSLPLSSPQTELDPELLAANKKLLEARKNLEDGRPPEKGFLGFGRLGFGT